MFSLAGGLMILRNRSLRRSPLLWLLLWYLLSFGEAGINLELFAHYYLLIVPPLAILAAWFLRKLYHDLVSANSRGVATAVFSTLLIISLGLSIWENGQYWQQYIRYKIGEASLAEFVELGWPRFGQRLTRVASLADFVAEQTEPEDRVYYWSEDVQLYYLANRQPPIDMIWPIDIGASGPPERIFGLQTRLVIVDQWRETPPDWFMAELAANYLLDAEFDEQVVYRRVE
jgi:hypothetical protein